jgi:DNA-binding transcriptional LysR family regulator
MELLFSGGRTAMDISYFRDFVILAETQNYWEAAERLYIGQSSLSKHIIALEKHLGAPLFERTTRKVSLTDFGAKMLPYAQSIAKLQYAYEAEAYNYLHVGAEVLHIGSIPAMAHYHITDSLLRFRLDFPNVQLKVQEADTLEIRELLLARKCEIGILRDSAAYLGHDPDKENQLAKLPYCTDRLVAVLPASHPLAAGPSVELHQLREENFALLQEGSMPYTLCMRACREAGFLPKVLFTSHNLEALIDMVSKGNCVALMFQNHVTFPHELPPLGMGRPFTYLPITPEISTTLYLSYRKDTPLSPAASHFLDYCMTQRTEGEN